MKSTRAAAPAGPAAPLPPGTVALGRALDANESFASLGRRMAGARARFDAVAPKLPPALRAQVAAGPLEETEWRLLVRTPGAAAKLRQLAPALQRALDDAGLGTPALKIVLSAATSGAATPAGVSSARVDAASTPRAGR